MQTTIIYTDGACSGNPGPGGWASILCLASDTVIELGGGERSTTNNRMEMLSALQALRFLCDKQHSEFQDVIVYTDSTYLIRGITQWVWGWQKRGWSTAEGKPVINRDLWEELINVSKNFKKNQLHWNYVRGHQGTPGNERCDQIAVDFSQGFMPELYEGPLQHYRFNMRDLPAAQALPEMKPRGEKTQPLGYLSNVGGIVFRHRDWSECERRVKGQSGAKFKKVMSDDEERQLLAQWGVAPEQVKKP